MYKSLACTVQPKESKSIKGMFALQITAPFLNYKRQISLKKKIIKIDDLADPNSAPQTAQIASFDDLQLGGKGDLKDQINQYLVFTVVTSTTNSRNRTRLVRPIHCFC